MVEVLLVHREMFVVKRIEVHLMVGCKYSTTVGVVISLELLPPQNVTGNNLISTTTRF